MSKEMTYVTNRGTASVKRERKEPIWSGKDFQKRQLKIMSLIPKSLSISCLRGTKSVIVSDYPKIESLLSHRGLFISSQKGTARRRL